MFLLIAVSHIFLLISFNTIGDIFGLKIGWWIIKQHDYQARLATLDTFDVCFKRLKFSLKKESYVIRLLYNKAL